MKDSDLKYELFFELSPDLLCIAGYDGYFKKVNTAVARTLGYSMEELYARPINEFVHPDHQHITAQVRRELTRSKPLYDFENKYLTKHGETVWLSWTSLPVESDELIFAIAKNVTHKKRQEEDRNVLLTNLTRMNKDLMKMNYATSDDLKSPVHSLIALFELMDLSKISDKETVELLEILQYIGEKVKNTLNQHVDLLTKRNKQETVLEQIDLQACLTQVLQSIATIVDTSKTTILADFTMVPTVWFNTTYMKSIFLNLITNAIKFASPDRLPVITISSGKLNGRSQLVIADNGSGFDASKLRQELYDLPQQFHDSPDRKGIGLFLVHSQVSSFGGEVVIESTIGGGTKVIIRF